MTSEIDMASRKRRYDFQNWQPIHPQHVSERSTVLGATKWLVYPSSPPSLVALVFILFRVTLAYLFAILFIFSLTRLSILRW